MKTSARDMIYKEVSDFVSENGMGLPPNFSCPFLSYKGGGRIQYELHVFVFWNIANFSGGP